MFNKDGKMEGYSYPKPSIEGGTVRSEPSPPAPLSRENAQKIQNAVKDANRIRATQASRPKN